VRLQTREARTAASDTLGVLETAALLRELTAGLIGGTDFDEALGRLADTCREAVPGVAWCGVTVLQAGQPASVAVSDEILRDLDELRPGGQEQDLDGPRPAGDGPDLDEPPQGADGPAMTAIRRRELILATDLRTEDRWGQWRRRALTLGVHGVLSAPFDVDEHVIGAISLYSREPDVLTPSGQLTAMLLAEHAGLLLAAVRDRAREAALAGELDESLTGGEVIGQAIGVIMSQRGCPAPEGLQVLRTASVALSIPLRELAERLVGSVARKHST
jgi:hypothetical protein